LKKEVVKPQNKRRKKFFTEKNIFVLIVVTPMFAGYVLLTLFPNLMSFYYSLLNWDGISKSVFVGLSNYIGLFQDSFMWTALSHNFIMVIVVPTFTILISVFLADLLVNRSLKGTGFFKVLFFFPNVLSVVVLGLIFTFVFDSQYGILNAILKQMGVHNVIEWLGNEKTALPSVMAATIWIYISFYLVIITNAMSTIPKSLYEAAILDGITNTKRLFKITMPLISPVIRICAILMISTVFKSFEFVMVLTRGGPGGATNVIGNYMFGYAFGTVTAGSTSTNANFGYASAIGVLLTVILVGGKLILDRVFKDESAQY
jgi:N-acetylglucosamine transport system permease protein